MICPVGFGGLFLALYVGFKELIHHNLIGKMPRLLGVQPDACCPVYQAFRSLSNRVEKYEQRKPTIAEGLCAAEPVRGAMILRALAESKGAVTVVSEKEIREGVRILAAQGFLVEPSSAVVVKAIDHFSEEGLLSEEEQTVVILTGTGLKSLPEIAKV